MTEDLGFTKAGKPRKRKYPEHRKSSPRPTYSPNSEVNGKPGDNQILVNHMMRIRSLAPIENKEPETMKRRIDEYFQICAEDGMKPTIAGLASAFKVDRRSLLYWYHGKNIASDAIPIIKEAYDNINLLLESAMQEGGINPVAGIFLMKNNLGYQDKTETEVIVDNSAADKRNIADIRTRYLQNAESDLVIAESAERDSEES